MAGAWGGLARTSANAPLRANEVPGEENHRSLAMNAALLYRGSCELA
jgi:hypothetical protein